MSGFRSSAAPRPWGHQIVPSDHLALCPQCPTVSIPNSVNAKLTDVMPSAVLDIAGLLQSALEQLSDPLLRGWPRYRCETHSPLRCDFIVGWQAGHVDEPLGLPDRLLVECSDPGCQ